MKKLRICVCAGIMALICMLTYSFLQHFTVADSPLLGMLDWETMEITDKGGNSSSFGYDNGIPNLPEGAFFRFSLRLPENSPSLSENSYLLFETAGAQITVTLNGKEYYSSSSLLAGQNTTFQQVHLPLPPDCAGKELVMVYVPTGGETSPFPPVLRISSEEKMIGFFTSAAYRTALPAGAFALGFLLVCAVFLISVAVDHPDWSLIPLALAVAANTLLCMNIDSGFYFLPRQIYLFLLDTNNYLVPLALLAVYLFLNRKRTFWRYLGWISLWTLLASPVLFFLSALWQGPFFLFVKNAVTQSFLGVSYWLLEYLNIYLTVACSSIAAYSLLTAQLRMKSSVQALDMKNKLLIENYHTIEDNLKRTAIMRHEWKNQVTSLHLLQEKGNLDGLGAALDQLDVQLDRLSPRNYCENYTINAILQNTASRAEALKIAFCASAAVPADLSIDESDLCSFLLNLLDNAINAAAKVPEADREILCVLKIRSGYLALKCENSYCGELLTDKAGNLQTTHPERSSHGFGLAQMRTVAEKYGSSLDISYTHDRFTVQTALKLP